MSARSGTIADVKHVVILMQENRSFDHYFGTLGGVLGYGDTNVLTYPNGTNVFEQVNPTSTFYNGILRPYWMNSHLYNTQMAADLNHQWPTTHQARNSGWWNQWIPAKTAQTMGHFQRADIPWHYALADAYTICDQYHCSILGPTTPNRLYHWTGTINPSGNAGGPAIDNPPDYQAIYSWDTYPQRLQKAGISWKVYANDEVGDTGTGLQEFVGDYGDNPLWLFYAYEESMKGAPGSDPELAQRASVQPWQPYSGRGWDLKYLLADFIEDCQKGTLPTVSWIVAPQGYCEHPAMRPADGASYVNEALQALWSNQDLWAQTVFLLNYDENDGYFDHVIPPAPPLGTPDEFVDGLPIGLGPRVPMIVVSPWSRGRWVSSEVYDHTSVLMFLEKITGVQETNISAWRRSICGDLTNALDFSTFDASIPTLPDTQDLVIVAGQEAVTLAQQPVPTSNIVSTGQEPGTRQQRPIPYGLQATAASSTSLTLHNSGSSDAAVGIYPNSTDGPAPVWVVVPHGGEITVTLPNGFASPVTAYGPAGFRSVITLSGGS